jgi:hypothetical protein
MASIELPALPSSKHADRSVSRHHGLELFCVSFLALFLELMVIPGTLPFHLEAIKTCSD